MQTQRAAFPISGLLWIWNEKSFHVANQTPRLPHRDRQAEPPCRGYPRNKGGILCSQRGRGGGLTLDLSPAQIRLGDVFRVTEPDFEMVECLEPTNACAITSFCGFPVIATEALNAFMAVMDRHTRADLILQPQQFGVVSSALVERPSL